MNKEDLIFYKGYYGSVHFDAEQELFYGKLEFIRDLVNFEAEDAKLIIPAFHDAVDGYLEDCKELEKQPNIPFKGSFNVRVSPELHRQLGIYAVSHKDSINNVVKSALKEYFENHQNSRKMA